MNIYALLSPIAMLFILLEIGLCWYYNRKYITFQESIANYGTAMGNQTSNVLVATGVLVVYGYLWENFRFIDKIEMNWFTYLLLLLGVDFIFYWVHRWGHHVNIMWAAHSPHHSAEEMSFLVALRASVTQRLFAFFFFWPLTLIGFEPKYIYAMSAIHLFIAFFHHTEFIPKLWRWVEYVFTTPSHHRVHHGVNFIYLDKNFGEFLIIWDRIFGSFEEETDKAIYGMYHGPTSWNPISINFHFYITLYKDAKAAPYLWDKIRIWFMPLGWRPRGLPPYEPIVEITPENQVRFQTTMFPHAKVYLLLQVVFVTVLMLMIITEKTIWTVPERWLAAGLLWHSIINWSGIMESKTWSVGSEITRIFITTLVLGYFNYNHMQDMANNISNVANSVLLLFQAFSLFWCIKYFYNPQENKPTPSL